MSIKTIFARNRAIDIRERILKPENLGTLNLFEVIVELAVAVESLADECDELKKAADARAVP